MDLKSLRYFIAVLEAGSLSRAAASLYVAQPALTAQIKKLEQDLQVQLFERSHVGVTPTAAGLQLYHDARRLLADAAALQARLREPGQGPEGTVTLALPFLLASLLAGPLLLRVRERHPRIQVFVLDGLSLSVQKAMRDGRADVGVLVDVERLAGVACQPLAEEPMYLCGYDPQGRAVALARREGGDVVIDFAAAATLPLALQSRRYAIRQSVEAAAARVGVALNVVHEQDSARVIRSLYLAGGGFTFTPACALPDEPGRRADWFRGRVVAPDLLRHYSLARPIGRDPSPATEAVVDALKATVAGAIGSGGWMAVHHIS